MPSFTSFGEDSTISLSGLFYAKLLLFGDEISQSGAYFTVPKPLFEHFGNWPWFSKIWSIRHLLTGDIRCRPSFMENIDLVFMFLNKKLELQVFIRGLKDPGKNVYPLDYNSTSFSSNCSSCHEQFKSSPVTQFAHGEASSWVKPDGAGAKY